MAITVEYPVSRPSRLPGEDEADDTSWERHTELIPLGSLRLGPYETQDVALDDAFGLLPLPLPFCSIRIQHSGPPGSVVGEVSSVERGGDLVIDSHVANEGDGWAGSGGNPWRLDEETESVLFLTNMGEKAAEIGFQVQSTGVHYYLTDLRLKPHETRAIDIRKLRDAQKPDFQGNVIPAEASDGSVLWIRMDNLPVMGRMLVLKHGRRMASNRDCGYCPCQPSFFTLEVTAPTGVVLPGGSEQYQATESKLLPPGRR